MNTKATLAILTLTLALSAVGCMPHYGHARHVRYVGSPVRAPVRVLVPHAFGPRFLGMAPAAESPAVEVAAVEQGAVDEAAAVEAAAVEAAAVEARPVRAASFVTFDTLQVRTERLENKNLSTLLSGVVAAVERARNLQLASHVSLHVDAGFQVARLGAARAHDDNWDRSTPSWELPDARSAAHLGPRANGNGPYANVALTVEL